VDEFLTRRTKGTHGAEVTNEAGKDSYSKRSQTVEPVFGQHVNRDLDRFILRGEVGAAAEWSLFSATHSLLKLWRTRWESADGS